MMRGTMTLRDRWLDSWHALPPFRGRLAIARVVARTLLSNRRNRITFAPLSNGYRVKIDLGWSDAYDSLYYFRTGYEEPLTRLMRAVLDADGGSYADVGANVGIFCFAVADILRLSGGKALAIEPVPNNFAFLQESIDANELQDVIDAVCCAAGDREGTLMLSQLAYGEVVNAVPLGWGAGGESDADILRWSEPSRRGEGVTLIETPMTTLDKVVRERNFENVAMLKIDVEGAELFVLRGAVELLRASRPVVYAEFHQPLMIANGTTFEAIAAFCEDLAYEMLFFTADGRLSAARPAVDAKYLNAVLIPRDAKTGQREVIGRLR